MKTKKTNLILVISILTFLIVIVFFVYFLRIIKNKNNHISAVMTTLENKITEKRNLNVLEKKRMEMDGIHKRIGGFLVNTASIDTFVEYLEGVGFDNNVELTVKGIDVPKNEKNKININLDMRGSFQDVMKVVALLENAPFNIIISSTFLNKEESTYINPSIEISKNKELPLPAKSLWQANVSFSVLTL
jgi:Tfp pilus assembly protein PilO